MRFLWFGKRPELSGLERRVLVFIVEQEETDSVPISKNCRLGVGPLYGALATLEARGLVSSRWGDITATHPVYRRRMYAATKDGRLAVGRAAGL